MKKITTIKDLNEAMGLSETFREYYEDEKDYGFEIETEDTKYYILNNDFLKEKVWDVRVNYCPTSDKTFLMIDHFHDYESRNEDHFLGWYYGEPNNKDNEFYISDFEEHPQSYGVINGL